MDRAETMDAVMLFAMATVPGGNIVVQFCKQLQARAAWLCQDAFTCCTRASSQNDGTPKWMVSVGSLNEAHPGPHLGLPYLETNISRPSPFLQIISLCSHLRIKRHLVHLQKSKASALIRDSWIGEEPLDAMETKTKLPPPHPFFTPLGCSNPNQTRNLLLAGAPDFWDKCPEAPAWSWLKMSEAPWPQLFAGEKLFRAPKPRQAIEGAWLLASKELEPGFPSEIRVRPLWGL